MTSSAFSWALRAGLRAVPSPRGRRWPAAVPPLCLLATGRGVEASCHSARAYQADELASAVTEDEAVEWAALVLLLIPTMPGSSNLDVTDPRSFGRTLARRICLGIGRRLASAGNRTAGVRAKRARH